MCKGRAGTKDGALPVDDVDGDDEDEGDCEEDCRGDLEMLFAADVGEEWCSGDGEDTSKEVTGPAIATSGRGRVGTVGRDHVVDGGHVDAVVRNTHNCSEDA